ncbi:MAG: methylenetetrahydrofolate--tRNA-(uracil(54)-C(5))-methyltransferase (FADH(2)-oxidizing) TrmFO, partial [Oscillospiraceae bacterium]|nr:methylenetetrahydrofolate--tRNA-(uracil(54)-C(5))-methyltransferase (FADH(2)-oxidizing) TrmFO [Oscillospiraceae bacterium]
PKITVFCREVGSVDMSVPTVIATGPLTDGALADWLSETAEGLLSFYDAAAPIVSAESIDMDAVFAADRYSQAETGDYLNCYFDKPGYEAFYSELVLAQTAELRDFDYVLYEGCMPIERLAARGADTPRFGPMKPVGLRDPRTGRRPWAAVQLRREDEQGSLYNLVGFQTNLKFPEQRRVFRMIPGLERAEFVRYGVMHRNSFLDSPKALDVTLNLKNSPNTYVAGQLTGFEGYMESALSGILAARFMHERLEGGEPRIPTEFTMCGALLRYITRPNEDFQPMGANMGLLPPLEEAVRDKRERYAALAQRALEDMEKMR